MNRLTPTPVLALIIVGMVSPHQSRQANPTQHSRSSRAPSSIIGQVLTARGDPLAEVQVVLGKLDDPFGNRPGRVTTTALDGRFEFENVARGVYIVTATDVAQISSVGVRQLAQSSPCRPGDSVTVRMSSAKGGVLTGRVTDVNGKPAIEAHVRAVRLRDSEGRSSTWLTPPVETFTDDRGVYRIWWLPAGIYNISAVAGSLSDVNSRSNNREPRTYFPSSIATAATEVILNESEERTGLDIRLLEWNTQTSKHTIRGKVSGGIDNSSDRGSFGVVLWNASSGPMLSPLSPVIDQTTGEFRFEAVAAGDYCLQALAGDRMEFTAASAVRQVVVKDSDISGQELRLIQPASISGRMSVEQLPARAVKTCSQLTEPVIEETLISFFREDMPTLDTENKCMSVLNLLVSYRGAAADWIARTTPDARGEVSIRHLDSGRYRFEIEPPNDDYYLKAITALNARPNRPVDVGRSGIEIKKDGERVARIAIILAPGAAGLSGSIAPYQTGAKLPSGLIVLLIPAEPQSSDDLLRFAETPVTSSGAFTFKNVAPGRYLLLVQSEQIGPERDSAPKRRWWDANTRAALRREAEKANAVVDLRLCSRVKNHVLVYSEK